MWVVRVKFPSGLWDEPRCFANTEDAWRYMSSCARSGVQQFRVKFVPEAQRS